MGMYQDIKRVCKDCKESFIWSEGEQDFLHELVRNGKILQVGIPLRCPDCNYKRKLEKEEQGI